LSRRNIVQLTALFIGVTGLTIALLFDKVGSVELFFSGVALFVSYDLLASKPSNFFDRHEIMLQIARLAFASAFAILFVDAVFELAYYPAYYWQLSLPTAILGILLLFLGVGPYMASVLRKGEPKER